MKSTFAIAALVASS
jgi:hypothetical protein